MTYTLFIDESGDFDQDPRWIVSGVLCEGSPDNAEKRLKQALESVLRQFQLSALADLHLTELRQRLGNRQAVEAARAVFDVAESTGNVTTMLVVENERRVGLRESERTYRLMLLDLLALADTALPEARGDHRLEVIVARRQKQGELMSTRDELLADVVERIADAVEAGLAAKGLLDRLDAGDVRIWRAKDSAGLAVADFAANLAYNRHRVESGELYSALERAGRIRLFEGFGGYAERRARIAERDGDLAAALARWSLLKPKKNREAGLRQEAALVRLWRRTMLRGSAGPMATLDATLERLWRQHQDPASHPPLAAALGRLEASLLSTGGAPELVYRLRNLMHLVANQVGDLVTADRLAGEQAAIGDSIAVDPSLFHLVLDTHLLRTVTEELRLDFAAAILLARMHCDLVGQYGAVWELLAGDRGHEGFTRSRLWAKAQMTLLRTLLLSGEANDLREADELLDVFGTLGVRGSDQTRLDNYRVWADVRCGRWDSAVGRGRSLLERDPGIFAAQFAARAAADAVIHGQTGLRDDLRAMLGLLRDRLPGYSGHPGDLVWRDVGVLEHAFGRGKKAGMECMERSLTITRALPVSPANAWVRYVTEVHRAAIGGSGMPASASLPDEAMVLLRKAQVLAAAGGALRAYRKVSPY
ncbi:MAG: DUF3800 domain-containing protein [Chromatiaceae bacterium]|jgi:hypothetical protein|nr:DUF3800 domain-containing protein [Chromatiaceae bacterium]